MAKDLLPASQTGIATITERGVVEGLLEKIVAQLYPSSQPYPSLIYNGDNGSLEFALHSEPPGDSVRYTQSDTQYYANSICEISDALKAALGKEKEQDLTIKTRGRTFSRGGNKLIIYSEAIIALESVIESDGMEQVSHRVSESLQRSGQQSSGHIR